MFVYKIITTFSNWFLKYLLGVKKMRSLFLIIAPTPAIGKILEDFGWTVFREIMVILIKPDGIVRSLMPFSYFAKLNLY